MTQVARTGTARSLIALLRPRQWSKNVFVLVPLLFSKKLDDPTAVADILGAFVVFCLIASFVYVLNDWRDREEDAAHPTKSSRPLACGAVSTGQALAVAAACLVAASALIVAFGFNTGFIAVIATYVAINLAYSFGLRHVALLDILIIATGFVLRILAGTTAIQVEASQFLILCGGLLALLLAVGKRRADLKSDGNGNRPALADYSIEFIDVALAVLASAVIGFYCLFTVSDYAIERYGSDLLYLTTFFVVAGVLRYLQIVIGKGTDSGPTEIALGDRFIQVTGALWVAAFVLIGYVF
jgi:decaprenyl-phosphate phosphoribosyltransferase